MILCARRYWRDQCHGGIPACCASVLYSVEEAISFLHRALCALVWNNKKCLDTVDARYKHEDHRSCLGSPSLRIPPAQEGTTSLPVLGVTVSLVITGSWHWQHWECWANTNWGFGRKQVGVLGEYKLGLWEKTDWSVGRIQIGALGENRLECWANTNMGFGRKQIGVLGEHTLGRWEKTDWSVGRTQIGALGENRLECWANTNWGFGRK